MLIFISVIIFLKLIVSSQNKVQLNDYVNELTENLIANLRADPFLNGESSPSSELSKTSKEFIDKHIERYSELVLTFQQREFSRSKRSLVAAPGDGDGSERQDSIIDITPYGETKILPSTDIRFFQQNSQWYAVSLENTTTLRGSDRMRIMKYQGNASINITETKIHNGVRVAAFPMQNSTLIVVAENATSANHVTNIFEFNFQEELHIIQKINGTGYTDVVIWEDNGNVFMSLVGFMGNSAVSSSSFPRLYKWRGRHFDVLQDIRFEATRVSPFLIGDLGFVAVVNNAPGEGEPNEGVYSEILKYNLNTEKYELFQKILTYACDDIKYFEIDTVGEMGDKEKERFLVVANFYEKDSSGNISYSTPSIVYKFMDNYFFPFQSIALKGVRQWEAIENEYGDLLLIALTLDGIKTFQYDGWHFVETSLHFKGKSIEKDDMLDVKTIHSFKIEDKQLLVAVRDSPNDSRPQIFEIQFSKQNTLRKLHDQLLTWCQAQTKIIDGRDGNISEKAPESNLDDDLDGESQIHSTDLEKLTSRLNKYSLKLSSTEQKLRHSVQSLEHHTIDRHISAKLVLINSTSNIESLFTKKLNGVDIVGLLENSLNINDNFEVDSELKTDFIRMDGPVLVETFNNHSTNSIIYKTEESELKTIIINGSAIFNNNVTVTNNINNITIGEDTLLLKSGDQNLVSLRVSKVDAEKLNTSAINGRSIDELNIAEKTEVTTGATPDVTSDADESGSNARKEKVKSFKEVKAKNLIVGGFINDVDIPTLEKYALRKAGKQDITQTYYFDKVEAERLDAEQLSMSRIPEDFIVINNGNLDIQKSPIFEKPLTVNNMFVVEHLNNLLVNKKGELQILLKNSSTTQRVFGLKTFENLDVLNPIDIQGKIQSKYFDSINPIVEVSSNLSLKKDVTITGNVLVKEVSKSVDVISRDNKLPQEIKPLKTRTEKKQGDGMVNNLPATQTTVQKKEDHLMENVTMEDEVESMMRVVRQGVKLEHEHIHLPVKFMHQLNVSAIKADLINDLDPSQFVVKGATDPLEITGRKTFEGDLEITGNTIVKTLNGITAFELENNVLKTNADQVIGGKHHIKRAIILGRLTTNKTNFGKHLWRNVVTTSGNQTVEGIFKLNNLSANSTSVTNIHTHGQIIGINFSEILQDAVPMKTPLKINGTKTFQTLNITHLRLNNNFDLDKRIKAVDEQKLHLDNVDKLGSVSAENVYFGKNCNGIFKTKFENISSSQHNITLNMKDERDFDTITVLGNVFIQNNLLNNVDMDSFELDTVKIDEPFDFENADFGKKLIVTPLVSLQGQIENLDVDSMFENGKEESQTIDKITFKEDIKINGSVHINGFLNGLNVSDLCGVFSEFRGPKKLVIEGNVHFTKGPSIGEFNGLNAKDMESTIWFTDSPATLSGNIAFEGDVTLRDSLTIKGLMNDVHLDHLSDNYLSKTKDQKIVAHINLLNTTIFEKDLATPAITVGGLVNNIKLENFLKNALLHRPQLFEDLLYFEEVTANHLEGNYLVNKLNLDSEVMRYDRPNLITGSKTFENLDVDVLRPERETPTTSVSAAKVQEVEVDQWLQQAILKEGNYKIGGRKKFNSVEVKEGISIIGRFNGVKLDPETTMMKHSTQNITGKKTFVPRSLDEVKFKALKVKGLVNGENFELVLQNQAYRNEDNTFNSTLKFCNNISTGNLILKKRYSGVDVTELLHNITTLGSLNHIKEKYENLKEMANEVETYLSAQAYFLDYYKPVPLTFQVNELFSLKCTESENRIVSFRNESGSNILKFLDWDEKQEMFVNKSADTNIGSYPNYMNPVVFEDLDKIYLEHDAKIPLQDNTHTGRFMTCNNDLGTTFLTKGTLFATGFEIKSQKLWCLLLVDFNFDINIPCSGIDKPFHQHQTIRNKSPVMASIVMANNKPFLVTIHKEIDKKTTIWNLNKEHQFEVFQTHHDGDPISISTLSTEQGTFLAIAYKHLPNTRDYGKVIIRRFDSLLKSFPIFQTIHVSSPTKVVVALLPSKEIGLYVITDNPSEPLAAYLYSGVEGFVNNVRSPSIPKVNEINTFSFRNQHFVIIKHEKEVSVLQAVFKGSKFNER